MIPYVVWVCILGSISTLSDHSHMIGNLIVAAKELWFFPTLFMFEAVLILFVEVFKKKKSVTGLGLILLLMACFQKKQSSYAIFQRRAKRCRSAGAIMMLILREKTCIF